MENSRKVPIDDSGTSLIHIYYEGDDDPKKCTAKRMEKFGLAELHTSFESLPRGTLLNPYAEQAFSPADSVPVIGLDASWKSAEPLFDSYMGEQRALPFLVAANPVNYGTAFKLNTAEAVAGALYILGYKEEAEEVMSKFKWGSTFLELNREPLERYSECDDSEEIVEVQEDYLAEE